MAIYYVATDGSNGNPGTLGSPWATIAYADTQVSAGDTVFFRGGTYNETGTTTFTTSGSDGSPITYAAYNNEVPVFDYSGIGAVERAFYIRQNWLHFIGLTITGTVQGTLFYGAGFEIAGSSGGPVGSNNIIERCIAHDLAFTGFVIKDENAAGGASNNLLLNCDAYDCHDDINDGEGADGFMVREDQGPGNVVRGCRAWRCSDDGYDFFDGNNGITVDKCWAWDCGFDYWDIGAGFDGNGIGFKIGTGSGAHTLTNCIAAINGQVGFDDNGNSGPSTLINCTSYNHAQGGLREKNYDFDASPAHSLKNCVSFGGGIVDTHTNTVETYNSWNSPPNITVVLADVVSTDTSELLSARKSDGSLPDIDFMRPTAAGQLASNGEGGTFLGALAPAGSVSALLSYLWKGAAEPADFSPSGNEYQAWRGAAEVQDGTTPPTFTGSLDVTLDAMSLAGAGTQLLAITGTLDVTLAPHSLVSPGSVTGGAAQNTFSGSAFARFKITITDDDDERTRPPPRPKVF